MENKNATLIDAAASGVSWGAVLAGAMVAAAMSLALLALGTGLGMSAMSLTRGGTSGGTSFSAFGVATIVWLILMQIISGSLGAYVAGRLRTRWANVHVNEVFFRDTAHGFLVWATGLVLTAVILASAGTGFMGAVKDGATVSQASGTGAVENPAIFGEGGRLAYTVDILFRDERPGTASDTAAVRTDARNQAMRMFVANRSSDDGREFDDQDRVHLARLISAQTGLPEAEADKRIAEVLAKMKAGDTVARQTAQAVQKAVSYASLWIFLSLLIGAFCASLAATIGGRQRDNMSHI